MSPSWSVIDWVVHGGGEIGNIAARASIEVQQVTYSTDSFPAGKTQTARGLRNCKKEM